MTTSLDKYRLQYDYYCPICLTGIKGVNCAICRRKVHSANLIKKEDLINYLKRKYETI